MFLTLVIHLIWCIVILLKYKGVSTREAMF